MRASQYLQVYGNIAFMLPILTDCLQTLEPKVFDFPGEIAHPADPVSWALDMFAASVTQADMQVWEPSSEGRDSKLSFFDQKDPGCFEQFKNRIQNMQPVHGSLALIDYCSGDGTVRDDADWAWQVFEAYFAEALAKCHPLGSYLRASLWLSCGDHRYEAHNDLSDGLLIHLNGHKRVRVWPTPKKYLQKVVFNHSDFEGRMASEPIDFELKPGQILFIPSGAMHEVVAHGEESAVSVSYHMGSPFPMAILCKQLNRILKGGEVSLPPYMKAIDKFNIYFFEPTHFIEKDRSPDDEMPEKLLKALAGVLQSKQVDSKTMRKLLLTWWRFAMRQPVYQGPYPERV